MLHGEGEIGKCAASLWATRHSEVEMIGALKQMDSGPSAVEVGRRLGVSKPTIYASKSSEAEVVRE